ncbi:MAG: hypothetical protein GWP59_03285 [Chlamydiales bacterium]|nr:hypothetical protein [Chlamydiales bacterium]NCF70708.1 hypothetical protein [Chlamydiales bacterium]
MFEWFLPGPVKSAASEIKKFSDFLEKDEKCPSRYEGKEKLVKTAKKAFAKITERKKGKAPKNLKAFNEAMSKLHNQIGAIEHPETKRLARDVEMLMLAQQVGPVKCATSEIQQFIEDLSTPHIAERPDNYKRLTSMIEAIHKAFEEVEKGSALSEENEEFNNLLAKLNDRVDSLVTEESKRIAETIVSLIKSQGGSTIESTVFELKLFLEHLGRNGEESRADTYPRAKKTIELTKSAFEALKNNQVFESREGFISEIASLKQVVSGLNVARELQECLSSKGGETFNATKDRLADLVSRLEEDSDPLTTAPSRSTEVADIAKAAYDEAKKLTPENKELLSELKAIHKKSDALKFARGLEFLLLSGHVESYTTHTNVEIDFSSTGSISDMKRSVLDDSSSIASSSRSTSPVSSRSSSTGSEEMLKEEELRKPEGILERGSSPPPEDFSNSYYDVIEEGTRRSMQSRTKVDQRGIQNKVAGFYQFKMDFINYIKEFATANEVLFGQTDEQAEILFERSRILSAANRMSMGGATICFHSMKPSIPYEFSCEKLKDGTNVMVCRSPELTLNGFVGIVGHDAEETYEIKYSYEAYIPMSADTPKAAQMIETFSKPRD